MYRTDDGNWRNGAGAYVEEIPRLCGSHSPLCSCHQVASSTSTGRGVHTGDGGGNLICSFQTTPREGTRNVTQGCLLLYMCTWFSLCQRYIYVTLDMLDGHLCNVN